MALTKTVTKMFPTENTVGIHLKLEDDGVVIIDKDFAENYAAGQDIPNELRDKIRQRMQKAIDNYKALKARFEHPKYETVRTQIDNNLTL